MNIQKININTFNITAKSGFTLVELLVVITILAILGTIAFISLQGYSTQARDSVRINDINNIKTSLELFNLNTGKYPQASNGVNVTYSGSTVWNQGTFGESVFSNVSMLDKIPLDPITGKEYTYSTTGNKYEYQIGGIFEGDTISMNNEKGIMNEVSAGTIEATAYVTGNYNGLMTKSNSGVTCNILAVPSIITNDISITDLQQTVNNNSFVYRGYKNLPSSFKSSKFKYNGGFVFSPNNLVAYTDTGSCAELQSNTSYIARMNLLKGLQESYSGTITKNEGEIKNLLSLKIVVNHPTTDALNYSANLVNNNLGGKVLTVKSSLSEEEIYSISGCPTNYTVTNRLLDVTKQELLQNISNYIGCNVSGFTGKISGFTYSGTVSDQNKMVMLSLDNGGGPVSWGSYGTTIGSSDTRDGYKNTEKIILVQGTGGGTAAQLCDSKTDGAQKWYLPAINELIQLYCNGNTASTSHTYYDGGGHPYAYANCNSSWYGSSHIGSLPSLNNPNKHWSSTESASSSTRALGQYFNNGLWNDDDYKYGTKWITCVSRF